MKPYKKAIVYYFTAGEDWILTSSGEEYVEFEERRKNGQEDAHMYGRADKVGGRWVIDPEDRKEIIFYGGEDLPELVEAFFDAHGLPDE